MTVNDAQFPELFATSLQSDSFDNVLAETTDDFVLIDFYSPWCPHCQHFAPEFERLALGLTGRPSGHSIFSGTVDCVAFEEFCTAWGVNGYPTLRWGRRSDFLSDNKLTLTEHIDQNLVKTAESVAGWISQNTAEQVHNESIPTREHFGLLVHERVHEPSSQGVSQHAAQGTADNWDVQLAIGLFLHHAFAGHAFEGKPKQALLDFLQLLANRLPELRQIHDPQADQRPCRNSLLALHANLSVANSDFVRDVYLHLNDSEMKPKVDHEAVDAQWQLCGTNWSEYANGWGACKGTWPGKRGYTCGLWTMLHTLAASGAAAGLDADTVRSDHDIMRAALWFFFGCDDCRDHFFRNPVRPEDVATPNAAQLWWWNVHNGVTARVGKSERENHSGDPAYQKVQWPSPEECPHCRRASFVTAPDPLSEDASLLQVSSQRRKAGGRLGPHPSDGAAPRVADVQPSGMGLRTLSDAELEERWDLSGVASFLSVFYSPVPVGDAQR